MSRTLIGVIAIIIAIHGLIHLMGAAVYLKLGDVQGLAYKTTVLGGRVDLGAGGTRVFGAFWLMAAVGFIAAAIGLFAGWSWWSMALLITTVVSTMLTVLDWNVAFTGAIVDLAILGVLWFQVWMVTS